MATHRMNESWSQVKNQIELIWKDVDFGDKEMKQVRGDLNKMVDLIHDKTGDPRREIMQKMSALL
jgi:hypothetical protein